MTLPVDHICPHCGFNMKGDPIPQDAIDRGMYGSTCRTCGEPNHWGLEQAHIENDRIARWVCPNCNEVLAVRGEG